MVKFCAGMSLPASGGHAFPAPEGLQEACRLGVTQALADFADAQAAAAEQFLGQRLADLVDQLAPGRALGLQVPAGCAGSGRLAGGIGHVGHVAGLRSSRSRTWPDSLRAGGEPPDTALHFAEGSGD